jgi:hypothetical protein
VNSACLAANSTGNSIYRFSLYSLLLLTTLLGWASPSQAAQRSGSFKVNINLLSTGGPGAAPVTGICRSSNGIGAFGATLTVICSTGTIVNYSGDTSKLPWAPIQGSSFRYLLNVYNAGGPSAVIDSYTGVGTITTWRQIRLNDRDYLEMMVHW